MYKLYHNSTSYSVYFHISYCTSQKILHCHPINHFYTHSISAVQQKQESHGSKSSSIHIKYSLS